MGGGGESLCKCDCGCIVKPCNQYINGHNRSMLNKHHSKKTIEKIRKANTGVCFSEEHKAAMRGPRPSMAGDNNPSKRPDVRKKIRLGLAKRVANGSYVNGFQGRHHSEESKRKMGRRGRIPWNKDLPRTGEEKQNISESRIGILDSNESKCRGKKRIAAKKRWQNPEYREKQLESIFRGSGRKPTRPERQLSNLLDKVFPDRYKYVGNGSVILGGKNPDFINVNSQKKIIELFGDYWHSKECTGMSKQKHEQLRVNHFAKYGFDTLVIWECELQNESVLIQKIRKFTNQCHIGK